MTDHTPQRQPADRRPLDVRLDGVLTEFFRHEMPDGLGRGTLDWDAVAARSATPAGPRLVAAQTVPQRDTARTPQRRLAALVSVMALAACFAVALQFGGPTPSGGSVPLADQQPAAAAGGDSEDLMLVSPRGDQPGGNTVVGEHGLTIEETDGVDLNPSRK